MFTPSLGVLKILVQIPIPEDIGTYFEDISACIHVLIFYCCSNCEGQEEAA